MTPEELEEFGAAMVEQIQESVNAYYSQFEDPLAAEAAAEAAAETEQVAEAAAPAEPAEAETPAEAGPADAQTEAAESGRMEDAGSPTHNPSEGSVPEGTGLEEGTPEGSGQ
jgi:hypothetical protein